MEKHPHSYEKCPKCGGDVTHGFGLMGGGYGPYAFCDKVECTWFLKKGDSEDESHKR